MKFGIVWFLFIIDNHRLLCSGDSDTSFESSVSSASNSGTGSEEAEETHETHKSSVHSRKSSHITILTHQSKSTSNVLQDNDIDELDRKDLPIDIGSGPKRQLFLTEALPMVQTMQGFGGLALTASCLGSLGTGSIVGAAGTKIYDYLNQAQGKNNNKDEIELTNNGIPEQIREDLALIKDSLAKLNMTENFGGLAETRTKVEAAMCAVENFLDGHKGEELQIDQIRQHILSIKETISDNQMEADESCIEKTLNEIKQELNLLETVLASNQTKNNCQDVIRKDTSELFDTAATNLRSFAVVLELWAKGAIDMQNKPRWELIGIDSLEITNLTKRVTEELAELPQTLDKMNLVMQEKGIIQAQRLKSTKTPFKLFLNRWLSSMHSAMLLFSNKRLDKYEKLPPDLGNAVAKIALHVIFAWQCPSIDFKFKVVDRETKTSDLQSEGNLEDQSQEAAKVSMSEDNSETQSIEANKLAMNAIQRCLMSHFGPLFVQGMEDVTNE